MKSLDAVGSILAVFCLLCACSEAPIQGAWLSDKARTLARIRDHPKESSSAFRELALKGGFYGKLFNIFMNGRSYSVYDGKCGDIGDFRLLPTLVPGRYVVHNSGSVAIGILEEDTLVISIPSSSTPPEYFKRVGLGGLYLRFPCLANQMGVNSFQGFAE